RHGNGEPRGGAGGAQRRQIDAGRGIGRWRDRRRLVCWPVLPPAVAQQPTAIRVVHDTAARRRRGRLRGRNLTVTQPGKTRIGFPVRVFTFGFSRSSHRPYWPGLYAAVTGRPAGRV